MPSPVCSSRIERDYAAAEPAPASMVIRSRRAVRMPNAFFNLVFIEQLDFRRNFEDTKYLRDRVIQIGNSTGDIRRLRFGAE